jgi:hypothetical protein
MLCVRRAWRSVDVDFGLLPKPQRVLTFRRNRQGVSLSLARSASYGLPNAQAFEYETDHTSRRILISYRRDFRAAGWGWSAQGSEARKAWSGPTQECPI